MRLLEVKITDIVGAYTYVNVLHKPLFMAEYWRKAYIKQGSLYKLAYWSDTGDSVFDIQEALIAEVNRLTPKFKKEEV